MPKTKPEESLENPNSSRSLGVALGVTECFFILGLLLLAYGIFLTFGVAWSLTSTGAILIFSAFYNAYVG